ncbi:uncharacterized protein BDZ83DRAFT_460653 [Colletotrichum acutatum]|uniref:Uncharacterized protein n=1 Tax=Glomerella acutata TaxID=27357 RepID=A0AAD8UH61_GLOAC|nr:uncharacterized protein BDZ83DRAFT_460653 [Colletotrichum acutatum]KAK1719449.1 hypothetical protein BDZ83DRAFT_460653 [Colletotrichum acutatum]
MSKPPKFQEFKRTSGSASWVSCRMYIWAYIRPHAKARLLLTSLRLVSILSKSTGDHPRALKSRVLLIHSGGYLLCRTESDPRFDIRTRAKICNCAFSPAGGAMPGNSRHRDAPCSIDVQGGLVRLFPCSMIGSLLARRILKFTSDWKRDINLAIIRLRTLYATETTLAPRRRHSRVSNCGLWYPAANRAGLTEVTIHNAELHALPEVGCIGNTKVPFQRVNAS